MAVSGILTRYKNKKVQHDDIFLSSRHNDLTIDINNCMASQQKDLTSRHNYLTSDGRNMPPTVFFVWHAIDIVQHGAITTITCNYKVPSNYVYLYVQEIVRGGGGG